MATDATPMWELMERLVRALDMKPSPFSPSAAEALKQRARMARRGDGGRAQLLEAHDYAIAKCNGAGLVGFEHIVIERSPPTPQMLPPTPPRSRSPRRPKK